jgi:hypothetical protein
MHKDPELKVSPAFDDHAQNITLTGISLNGFCRSLLRDQFLISRYGVLLDYSEEMARPYWSGYPTECIVNWHTKIVNGYEYLTKVCLKEEIEEVGDDGYEIICKDRYRVAYLDDDGYYVVETHTYMYTDEQTNKAVYAVETYEPTRQQQRLTFIPFQMFGVEDLTPHVNRGVSDTAQTMSMGYT